LQASIYVDRWHLRPFDAWASRCELEQGKAIRMRIENLGVLMMPEMPLWRLFRSI
jgi:hypothetical protein